MPRVSEGCDYFATQPQAVLDRLKASGISFVARYYDNSLGTSAKCLKPAEVRDLLAAGLDIFPVFETEGGAFSGADYFTAAQGAQDGAAGLACAVLAGQPEGSTIYYAVDYNVPEEDFPAIDAYFHAVEAQHGSKYRVGVYGSYRVCAYLHAQGFRAWETYAWSRGRVLDGIDLYQYENDVDLAGIKVDRDRAFVVNWSSQEEEEMTYEQFREYFLRVYAELGVAQTFDGLKAVDARLADTLRQQEAAIADLRARIGAAPVAGGTRIDR